MPIGTQWADVVLFFISTCFPHQEVVRGPNLVPAPARKTPGLAGNLGETAPRNPAPPGVRSRRLSRGPRQRNSPTGRVDEIASCAGSNRRLILPPPRAIDEAPKNPLLNFLLLLRFAFTPRILSLVQLRGVPSKMTPS